MFGSWVNNLGNLCESFKTAQPYSHVVIDNFFNDTYADKLHEKFPEISHPNWFSYWNPIEKKFAMNNFKSEDLVMIKNLFDTLQSDYFVDLMKKLTGIDNLESDPHLHGAGLHYHPTGGKLDMHLDYSLHPISGKERRVNLIIYMNKNWREEYGGHLQLWNKEFTECVTKLEPRFNRAALFQTSDISWHGLPDPIVCPTDTGRKSVAIYYVSDPRPNITHRLKAQYRPLPNQPIDERLKKLYEIRTTRIIKKEDLDEIYPNWQTDGNGFW